MILIPQPVKIISIRPASKNLLAIAPPHFSNPAPLGPYHFQHRRSTRGHRMAFVTA